MASNQATGDDLAARAMRPLTDLEQGWGTTRLQDAYDQIVVQVPSVTDRLDAGSPGDPFSRLVVQVQCAMVLRVLTNPDGIRSEGSDDYTRTLDTAVSSGQLYVTDTERALLTAWDGHNDGAWTIRPYAPPVRVQPDGFTPFPTTTSDTW